MRRPPLLALAALTLFVVACGEAVTGVSPHAVSQPARGDLAGTALSLAASHLVQCPATLDVDVGEIEVGVPGGSLSNGRQRLKVPGGAVDAPTRLRMRAPRSTLMEVELTAVGYAHFNFRKPVTVTIDFSRCAPEAVPDLSRLHVVHVDAVTKEVLEDMGGTVDPVERTITFETGHFSSYVIAD